MKTNLGDGLTEASNMAGLTLGEASLTSLAMGSNDKMAITEDSKLTVSGTLSNENAENLVIENGAQLVSSSNNVQATVKKNISPYSQTPEQNDGWNLIASPITESFEPTATNGLLTNRYDLYTFDQSEELEWRNYESQNFTTIDNGIGYLYANNQSVSLAFAGELQVGDATVDIPLAYDNTVSARVKGFNLVGNPYAHNITSYASVNVAAQQGCFRMNETHTDLMPSEISVSDPLKPAEGFFVKATGENATITFNSQNRSEMRRTGNISLELAENGQATDRLIVKRQEDDQNLVKLSLRDNRTKLFAAKDKQELAIVVCNDNEQPFYFKTAKSGTYTLTVNINDMEVDYLHLIDNLTGNNIDLLATPSYTFDARPNDYASRFRLVFEPSADTEVGNDCFAFISDGVFVITNEGISMLQVIDMTGRMLSSETINNSISKPVTLSSGVYVLRLINGEQVKTQKIVVR